MIDPVSRGEDRLFSIRGKLSAHGRFSFQDGVWCANEIIALRARVVELEAENARLRDDLQKAEAEIVATCEGCGAPLFEGDDFVSSEDCRGCWHTMTDIPSKRERPCYAYRVGKVSALTIEPKE